MGASSQRERVVIMAIGWPSRKKIDKVEICAKCCQPLAHKIWTKPVFARPAFLNQAVKARWLVLTVWLSFLGLTASAQNGLTATVVWDASPSTNVVAYNIYYGTRSGVYTNSLTVDAYTTSTEVDGLEAGTTYFFAVTAVDDLDDESDFSPEAYFTLPGPPKVLSQTFSDDAGNSYIEITSHQSVARIWEVQLSWDLIEWQSFTSGYGTDVDINFVIDPFNYPQLFFRVLIH